MTDAATPPPADDPRVTVRLLRFPLGIFQRSTEHHEGLMREMALLALRPPDEVPHHEVPRRLQELVQLLRRQYAGVTEAAEHARDAAIVAGLEEVDLTYHVPASAGPAAAALAAVLDEVDEFCRQGEMLTLATPPEALAFRRWYLGEFSDQIAGADPTPWPDRVMG